ncbi:MAG: LuxR C-terminal-related transcriptional regulator [Dysgonamonadaceae bacterium]|nr:LuxR C-terminal-related transcriptional regulator [Dysgonamonadaceae bacterium]
METENKTDDSVEYYLALLKTVFDAFGETVYVVDFKRRNFRFVSNRGIFLCGHSPDEVKQSGYDFYHEAIHQKDYQLVAKIHQVIVDYFSHPDTPISDLAYIVFDFRISGYKGKLMLSHKVMPLLVVNNRVLTAICIASRSASETSGNLIAYYNGNKNFCCQYSFENELWEQKPLIEISSEEWDILNLSKQGIKEKEIADIIGISHQVLRNILSSIYRKMNVHSKIQAVIFAVSHRLNIKPEQGRIRGKTKELPKGKKQRTMTLEKLQRIQVALNKGESVNSIAIREDVSESNLRYHISTGKLKRP